MQLCEDAGLPLPSPLTDADRLTPYGLSVRYGTAAPGSVDRDTALGWASAAVTWATTVIDAAREQGDGF